MAAGGWQVVAAVKNRDRGSLPRGVGVGMDGDGKGKGHRSGAAFVVLISHHAIHTYHVVVHLPCPCIPSIHRWAPSHGFGVWSRGIVPSIPSQP